MPTKLLFGVIKNTNLVIYIIIGMVLGFLFAIIFPRYTADIAVFGDFFITALKSVAPILVFILVTASISNFQASHAKYIKSILFLYILGMLISSAVAVIAFKLFPQKIPLNTQSLNAISDIQNIATVSKHLILSTVDNPVSALLKANYIGILTWAIALGLTLRHSSETTRKVIIELSESLSLIIKAIIYLAPVGIFSIVATTINKYGIESLKQYANLLLLLVGSMLFIALVVNPIIVFFKIKRNPYPLVFTCLKDSALLAFFTRSSAANIPANLKLADKLHVDKSLSSVAIPLGATINMEGAAITINILTLTTAYSLGIHVDFVPTLILCIISTIFACGASGVAGGSLFLVPVACSLFGIPNETAMQVVAIGFALGVVQDSTETALNSSADILFTTAVSINHKEK